jgi:hypothetical protein
MSAVCQNSEALEYIPHVLKTEEFCLAAAQQKIVDMSAFNESKLPDKSKDNFEMACRESNLSFCSFCGLPISFTKRLYHLQNRFEICICDVCIKNKDMLENLKLSDQSLYNEVMKTVNGKDLSIGSEEDYNRKIQYLNDKKEINFVHVENNPQWLTKISIEELRVKAKEFSRPNPSRGIEFNGIPIHENKDTALLEGEEFKYHPNGILLVSNLGRIKQNDSILEQFDPEHDNVWKSGYLFVYVDGKKELVYKLVAETWLKKPINIINPAENAYNYNTIHHITNNGYDNRIENLLRVTSWQHAMIHPYISINDFSLSDLKYLFDSYADVVITKHDYERILQIAQRIKQLESEYSKDYWQEIIEAFEKLIKKTEAIQYFKDAAKSISQELKEIFP